VATGTAANALALSAIVNPWDAVFCHEEAHIHDDECGAPELFTAGAKLVGIAGEGGKITPEGLRETLERFPRGLVKSSQPGALSLSQATEAGTVYSVSETSELSSIARRNGIGVHMDGARFANALVSAKATPAEMTWRAGVDILTLGATKKGALSRRADGGLPRRWAVAQARRARERLGAPARARPGGEPGRAPRMADGGQRGLRGRAERDSRALARGRGEIPRVEHPSARAGARAAKGRNAGEARDVLRNRIERNR